ncbi:MAG: redoxin domain-containing protein [Planctomycetes bacterium]|nr:redoxin domain-containing protein [Planctomycetota bacterium]
MRSWLFAACLVVGASPPVLAQEDDTAAAVQNDFVTTLRNNSAKAPVGGATGVRPPLISEDELQALIDRCWKIYDQNAGEPAEFEALNQVLVLAANPYLTPVSEKSLRAWHDAADKLFSDFIDDDRIAALALGMPSNEKLKKEADGCTAKLAGSKSLAVKAALAFRPLSQRADAASNTPLDAAGETRLIADLEAFSAAHGAQKQMRGGSYGDWVKNTVNALKNLKIGGTAPEIEGPDLDGVNFKLSDYRGKVVLLDFWGYW